MKKLAAVAVSIGVILVIVGLVIVGICGGDAIKNIDWNDVFSGTTHDLESAKMYIDKTSDELQGLENITIYTEHYSIYVLPADSDVVSVKYVEDEEDVRINVNFTNGVLVVTENDKLSTHFWNNVLNRNRFIVVYLPQTEMFTNANVTVTALTAAISVRNVTMSSLVCEARTGSVSLTQSIIDNVRLTADTGSVKVEALNCSSIDVTTETGSVSIKDTVAQNKVIVKVETGSVNCNVTANHLNVNVETGSVNFYAIVSDINITTETGSVNGKILGKQDDYQINVSKKTGKSNISNQTVLNPTRFLKVKVDTGSITVNFVND